MIADWAPLKCDCKGDLFIPLVQIKYKDAGGGTSVSPAGHKCAACGAVVDNAYMIRLIEINRKREDILRLTREVNEQAATAAPRPVAPAGRA